MPPTPRHYKDAIYAQLARIGKSLGSGPRLEILDLLGQSPRTVEALSQEIGQSMANTSHHLQVLRRARLVETKKAGIHVTYRLASPEVGALFLALRELAESRLLELEAISRDFHEARERLEPVGRDALVERIRQGDVTLLDVRPAEEFQAGHLPGARSVPLDDLERHLACLPRDREVVAYCRGPYCVMALEAVTRLREQGFTAHRLEDGVLEWRARGLGLEKGTIE